MDQLLETIANKRWNVRNQFPTADTEVLERYLARYVNRIAISKSRLEYVAAQQKMDDLVNITYKDYRKQVQGQPAPIATKSPPPASSYPSVFITCFATILSEVKILRYTSSCHIQKN